MTREQYRKMIKTMRDNTRWVPYRSLTSSGNNKCITDKGRLIPILYVMNNIGRVSTYRLDRTMKTIHNLFTTVDRHHNGRKSKGRK